jgi:hypothetical protein
MSTFLSMAEQIANRCRHFNGIDRKVCDAGVGYLDVRDDTTSPYRWPCFKSDNCVIRCERASFFSEQEIADEVARVQAHAVEFLTTLATGKVCPHCKMPITKRYEVGRCVYADPCGCRQYQGRLPKEEREK